jgi:hypothetical protein
MVQSGSRRFQWFSLETKFKSLANEVEYFSECVRLRRVSEDKLLADWRQFVKDIQAVLEQAGPELPEYFGRRQTLLGPS